jgi:starch-binding outer membrane protein, SusD/RagB family
MAPNMPNVVPGRRRTRSSSRSAALAALLVLVGACGGTADKLLSVTTPSRLADDQYVVPQNASLMVSSSIADFTCALGGYVVASGLTSGELADASQTASRWSFDRRDILPSDAQYATSSCTNLGVYTPISTARFTADQALSRLDSWTDQQVPNRQKLIATAALYSGFSYVLLAEGFCTATVNSGPEMQTAQLLDSAIARFSRAITVAQSVGDQTTLNAGYVGRARAKLDKGDKAGAAADAQLVPVSFVLNTVVDATVGRLSNRAFAENNSGAGGVTIAPAYRNLTVGGVPDPRVKTTDQGKLNSDQANRWFTQSKYPSLSTPTPIATGIEAQLILAEALGPAQGVAILNNLRARAGVGLPPLSAAEIADFQGTIYSERARELFLQGNHFFDVRRGNLPLVPAAGAQYPAGGAIAKAGSYGSERCWPLPDVERAANPNLGG